MIEGVEDSQSINISSLTCQPWVESITFNRDLPPRGSHSKGQDAENDHIKYCQEGLCAMS